MKEIAALFGQRKVDIQKLLAYGFTEHKGGYIYVSHLIEGQFEMTVTVTAQGVVSTNVVDTATGEDYILHRVAATTGAFVGKVREEYTQVLTEIAQACFTPEVFKSQAAKQVIEYIRNTWQDELEFLWPRFSNNAVVRRKDNKKWYAAILTVKKEKIGLAGEGTIEIIDLRMKPEDVMAFTDGIKYFPGYHMNKKHWVTLLLDGSIPVEEIFMRIDESYALALK